MKLIKEKEETAATFNYLMKRWKPFEILKKHTFLIQKNGKKNDKKLNCESCEAHFRSYTLAYFISLCNIVSKLSSSSFLYENSEIIYGHQKWNYFKTSVI